MANAKRTAGVLAAAMSLSGCAAFSAEHEAGALARGFELGCKGGASVVERRGYQEIERACMIGDVKHGRFVKVRLRTVPPSSEPSGTIIRDLDMLTGRYAEGKREGVFEERSELVVDDGRREDYVAHTFYADDAVVAKTHYKLIEGKWLKRYEVQFDAKGTLVAAHLQSEHFRLDADTPEGTGTFRITDAEDRVRSEGACRNGLRHGTWVERDADGKTVRQRSYRDGLIHGRQTFGAEAGIAHDGHRVGLWTVVFHGRCVRHGAQGSQCGHQPCEAKMAGGVAEVFYDDSDSAEIRSVRWNEEATPSEQRPEHLHFTQPAKKAQTCERLDTLPLGETSGPILRD